MGRDLFHPGVLDPQFLLEEDDLVVPAVDLSPQPDLTILTVSRPGQEYREAVVAEGQGVQDLRADAAFPAAGQG